MRSNNLYGSVNIFPLCSMITNAQEDALGKLPFRLLCLQPSRRLSLWRALEVGREKATERTFPSYAPPYSRSGSTMYAGAVNFLHLSGVPALWLSARFSLLPGPIRLQCNPLFSRFLRDHNKLLLLLVSGCLPLSSWFPQPALETHLWKSSHVHCLWENTFPIGSLINVRI